MKYMLIDKYGNTQILPIQYKSIKDYKFVARGSQVFKHAYTTVLGYMLVFVETSQ